MIVVKELTTSSQLREFVEFPFLHYEDNPYWVPPIASEELEAMDRDINPVFEHAEAHYFMAYKEDRPVGRIAAIINWIEVKEQQNPKLRFGWFDAINDISITKLLLGEVEKVGRRHGLKFMEGPVGFSNMDKAGLLVKGFEEVGTMVTWYTLPYYPDHLEQLGFQKANEWVEYEIDIPQEGPSEKVSKFSELILQRYDLSLVHFKSTQEIVNRAEEMFDLINKTYSNLSTFVPIQPDQISYYKEKYFRYLHPDFVNCLVDQNGDMVAFAITMPSFSKALRRSNGKLLPFGWIHLLQARFFPSKADFYLIGIKPEYQNKGLTAIIFKEMNETFNRKGIEKVETNPELEENKAIQALWKNYDHRLHKRRRTYKRDI